MNSPQHRPAQELPGNPRLAAFITAHGFGHCTRAIAVLQAAQRRCPGLELQLFTTAPRHLFEESLSNYTIVPVENDVGVIQQDAFSADLPATLAALDRMFPFPQALIDSMVKKLAGCSVVLCDISPLGIVAASAASIPSVLVENFTWDWIYQPFIKEQPRFSSHINTLKSIYLRATHHIQTAPVCAPSRTAVQCGPIYRDSDTNVSHIRSAIRDKLDVGTRRLILISLGGFPFSQPDRHRLEAMEDCFFVFTGQAQQKRVSHNVMNLCHDSGFYHPDLIASADLVICKSGYSTIAECYRLGARTVAIERPFFAESQVITDFVLRRLGGTVITDREFRKGKWLDCIEESLNKPRTDCAKKNCAEQVASLLLGYHRSC